MRTSFGHSLMTGELSAPPADDHTLAYVHQISDRLARVNTAPYGDAMTQAHDRKKTGGKARVDQRIGPAEWVDAGLKLLAKEGIDAVRVEPLAVNLGVTKGSFYWHFKDRAALHTEMLRAWRGVGTGDIIEQVEAGGGTGAERLYRLVELGTSNGKAASLETAVRTWARSDANVAEALGEVDRKRLDYVVKLLTASGLKRDVSRTRAKLLYLALIGRFLAEPSAQLETSSDDWHGFARTILLST
jgi:AcrR family transcriptional regulator